ncbi:hypothetical protein [Bremerella alba]|uniref:Uncharacterized protein n=1 Tax=Bremerella alba TaxID=980252 RepID=A0A7V8V4A1_9BACT|nr:hypothetical protein [Bremerella alba]MBA2114664.1 hypothetical protein [Bremerella alba]
MRPLLLTVCCFLATSPVFAQDYVAPMVPLYGDYGHASTAAEGALDGMANVVSAQGSYNLQSSEAAINMTQAQSQEIANHQQYADTYFQMRAQRDAYEAKKHPRPTEEQLVHLAHSEAPKGLPAGSVDKESGKLNWPRLLQYPDFAKQEQVVESLLKKKSANGMLGAQDAQQFTEAIEQMAVTLKRGITKVPPQQYMTAYDFLKQLLYSTCQTQLP